MAKIRSPLYSVQASGTVARLVTYRASTGKTTAQRPPRHNRPATHAQAAERARFALASIAWDAADQLTRDAWAEAAQARQRAPRQLWLSEYLRQNCQPGDTPLLPMPPTP